MPPVPLAVAGVMPASAARVHVKNVPVVRLCGVYSKVVWAHIADGVSVLLSFGVGFTLMPKVSALPVQPFADGVTVIVAATGAVAVLPAVNDVISPVPFAASPIEVLLFVQLYSVPVTLPL